MILNSLTSAFLQVFSYTLSKLYNKTVKSVLTYEESSNVGHTFWYDNFLKHMKMLPIHEVENLFCRADWLQFVQTEQSFVV